MQYQDWIKAKDELSPADRQAFEHELQDNARLQAEQEAFDLTDILLNTAASGLSEEAILQGAKPAPSYRKGLLVSVLAALVLTLGGALWWETAAPQEEPASPALELEMEQPEKAVPQQSAPGEPVAEHTVTPEPAPVAQANPVQPKPLQVKQQANPEPSVAKAAKPAKARFAKSSVELNQPVNKPEEVVAEGTIILKPGFHAKAGTTFSAKVENEKMLKR